MKNFPSFMISIVTSFFAVQQASATDIMKEELTEKKDNFRITVPLNTETEEILQDILNLNKVYKKAEVSKKDAPNSSILNLIQEHSSTYIKDLNGVLQEVEGSNDPQKRKTLVDSVHQKDNPFFSDYL